MPVVIGLAIAVTVAACGSSTTQTPKRGATKVTTISVAFQPNVNAASFLAQARNIYGRYHLNVRFVKFSSGPAETAALQGGEVNFAYGGSVAFSNSFVEGGDFRWVVTMVNYNKNEALVVSPKSGITSVDQLKGKTIGLPFGSDVQQPLVEELTRYHIPVSSVHLENLSTPAGVAAVDANDVSAMYEFSPYVEQAVAGGAHILFTSAETPGGGESYLGYATNEAWASTHRQVVENFLRALATASDEVPKYTSQTIAATVKIAGIPESTAQSQLKGEIVYPLSNDFRSSSHAYMCSTNSNIGDMIGLTVKSLRFFSTSGDIPKLSNSRILGDAKTFIDPRYLAAAIGAKCT